MIPTVAFSSVRFLDVVDGPQSNDARACLEMSRETREVNLLDVASVFSILPQKS